jgi:glucose-6-phosphate dehydrogenase assembly protein OpcA
LEDPVSALIDTTRLLRELHDSWAAVGEREAGAADGVLRACAMTLFVLTSAEDDPQRLGETLADIMHEHPSRAIVIRVHSSASGLLEGRVVVQCWMPFGKHHQICCEQVELTASLDRLLDLRPALLGLEVPDLPVVLWSRRAEWLAEPALAPLLQLPDKLVIDGAAFANARQALDHLLPLEKGGYALADLAWTRITRWRETIHRIFQGMSCRGRLESVDRIEISHAGSELPLAACYLGAWLSLAMPGAKLNFRALPAAAPMPGAGKIRGVLLEGQGLAVSLERPELTNVHVSMEGLETQVVFPLFTESLLLSSELAIMGHDPVFESALARAATLV